MVNSQSLRTGVVTAVAVVALQAAWHWTQPGGGRAPLEAEHASATLQVTASPLAVQAPPSTGTLSPRRAPASTNTAPGNRRIDAIEASLARLEANMARLSATRSSSDEGDELTDPAAEPALDLEDIAAQTEDALFELANHYDRELSAAAADHEIRAAIEARVANALAERAIGQVALLDSACSDVHCRLEFSSHGDRDGALASQLGLFMPDGTTSSYVPVYQGEDVVGTVVYLEFEQG